MERSEKLKYFDTIMDRIDALEGWKKEHVTQTVILHGVLAAWDNERTLEVFKEMVEEEISHMEK